MVEIAPLAYMRGRTLDGAFIVLDEAQNTTAEQMFMFLTSPGAGIEVRGDRRPHADRPCRATSVPGWSKRARRSRTCRASALLTLKRATWSAMNSCKPSSAPTGLHRYGEQPPGVPRGTGPAQELSGQPGIFEASYLPARNRYGRPSGCVGFAEKESAR